MNKNKSFISINFTNIDLLAGNTNTKCDFISCLLEPMLITLGILLNISFLIFVSYDKKTKSKKRKPLSHLLIAMIICDIWHLTSFINTFINTQIDVPDISSLIKTCQLSSYFSNYFAFFNLCILFSVTCILISIIRISPFSQQQNRNYYKRNIRQEDTNNTNITISNQIDLIESSQNDSNENRALKSYSSKLKTCPSLNQYLSNSKTNISRIGHKENLYIIFFSIFCLYLLSFLLWTTGDSTDEIKNKDIMKIGMCKTYDFAKSFMNIYQNSIKILRLIIILVGFIVSIIYHLKFKKDIHESFLKRFENKFNKNSQKIELKYFYIVYSSKSNSFETTTPKRSSQVQNKDLVYIRFWATFLFFYSALILFTSFKDVYEIIPSTYSKSYRLNIDDENEFEGVASYDFLFSFTEKLAHSCKSLIYLLFFVNLKFYFKLKQFGACAQI